MATKIPEPQPITVRLLKAHTHDGVPLNVGDTITLWPDQVAWLASLGVVDSAPVKE